jgi:hypothetical protein
VELSLPNLPLQDQGRRFAPPRPAESDGRRPECNGFGTGEHHFAAHAYRTRRAGEHELMYDRARHLAQKTAFRADGRVLHMMQVRLVVRWFKRGAAGSALSQRA